MHRLELGGGGTCRGISGKEDRTMCSGPMAFLHLMFVASKVIHCSKCNPLNGLTLYPGITSYIYGPSHPPTSHSRLLIAG